LHTCVEGRHFAIVARPEVVGLVLCVLGRASELFVGVVLVHFGWLISVLPQVRYVMSSKKETWAEIGVQRPFYTCYSIIEPHQFPHYPEICHPLESVADRKAARTAKCEVIILFHRDMSSSFRVVDGDLLDAGLG
jgi:hypothetical protein